ncbi:tetratricopeptide repeat protein [Sphingomonas sp. LB-2]|uniref:tetratricopeptide repeat protein n=1 Tax=Sphingomonas caeni TaxID=2984949 RepID=UPI0022321CC1|nr:tetratricopeptide repeat protein [Sphingomonas caeni]MCW3845760.1 tetratricopeptide repeat protein [Sphingomonas caeni]
MALPPSDTTQDAFVREVDEEFRRDQLFGLWQKYGRIAIGAVVGGLALFAAFLWWQHLNEASAGQTGEQFDAALKSGSKDELIKIADGKGDGYRAMARFAQADLALMNNDRKSAVARLAEVAGDAKLPQPLRDRALVQQTAVEFDTLQPQAVIDRLRGFAAAGSPWFGTAGEMVAIAYLRQGKRKEAGALFNQLAQAPDGQVPESIRQRAVQQAGVLGVYANDQLTEDKKPK